MPCTSIKYKYLHGCIAICITLFSKKNLKINKKKLIKNKKLHYPTQLIRVLNIIIRTSIMGPSFFCSLLMRFLYILPLFHLRHSSPSKQPLCHDDENLALLQFKESFIINNYAFPDPVSCPRARSWRLEGVNSDCFSWDGVDCDEDIGHVCQRYILDILAQCNKPKPIPACTSSLGFSRLYILML